MNNQAAQTMPELPDSQYRGGNDVFGKEFPLYTADQMHQYARDYAAMLAAAPAASGGECQHEWTTVGRGGVPKRELACMKCGRHRDHMAAPQLPSAASVSERARAMVDEVIEAAFGLESAEASRCPGENTDAQKDRLSRARSALEQALTQQRGEPVAWHARFKWTSGWSGWLLFTSKQAAEDFSGGHEFECRGLGYTAPQPSADAVREVPDGMVLVPREPDVSIVNAMREAYRSVRRGGIGGQTLDASFQREYAPELASYHALISAAGGEKGVGNG